MPSTREFAGMLNKLVTLESPSETGGDPSVSWPVVDTVWAEMIAMGGAELSGIDAQATYRFRLRYRADVTPRWRIGIGATRKLNILSVQDPDGRQRELMILAQEIV